MFNLSKEFWNVIENIPLKRVHELSLGDQTPVEIKDPEVKIEDMQVENQEEENIDIEDPQEAQGNSISFYGKI